MVIAAFNISQVIYEAVVLSIPMKKISPNVNEEDDYHEILEKFSPKNKEEEEETRRNTPSLGSFKKIKRQKLEILHKI